MAKAQPLPAVVTSLDHPERTMSAARFLRWRKGLGWNQTEAGRQLGMSMREIQRYEKGQKAIPRYLALACWALRKAPKALSLPPLQEEP